jgi:1-acyl-sn-glycerol-3-phosphate acyltransferase
MFETTDKLQVAITPEGTRKHVEEWKKGFYYIAIKANVPILMAYVDMKNKEIGFKGTFIPTGDADGDIAKIKSYYAELESAR